MNSQLDLFVLALRSARRLAECHNGKAEPIMRPGFIRVTIGSYVREIYYTDLDCINVMAFVADRKCKIEQLKRDCTRLYGEFE